MSEDLHLLVVEFLGLPGVGKSALCTRTASLLRERGYRVREPIRRLSDRSRRRTSLRGYLGKTACVVRELMTHPGRSLRALGVIRGSGQISRRTTFKIACNWLVQCAVAEAHRSGTRIVLLEEGIYQALWSLSLEGDRDVVKRAAPTLLGSVMGPDVVVVVHAGIDTVGLRLAGRVNGGSRADHWRPEDVETFARAECLLTEIEGLMAKQGGGSAPQVLSIENRLDHHLIEGADELADRIERLARGAPVAPERSDMMRVRAAQSH